MKFLLVHRIDGCIDGIILAEEKKNGFPVPFTGIPRRGMDEIKTEQRGSQPIRNDEPSMHKSPYHQKDAQQKRAGDNILPPDAGSVENLVFFL
jgi:hypothetical protein